jgi:adenylosuccinate synthase
MKKLFTVTDLGGGDGGKGGVVHKISSHQRAHTIIKVGGAQGSHGVRTQAGQNFNFSQFGCGTFEGAQTYLSELMMTDPYLFLAEGEKLQEEFGLSNIFRLVTADENALCITPYQMIASRLKELCRKEKQKGTVGIGAGETALDAENFPDLTIKIKDLSDSQLVKKLQLIREQKITDLQEAVRQVPDFWPQDQERAQGLLELLEDSEFPQRIADTFKTMGSLIKITGRDYLRREILGQDGVIVVESSHGILTDRYCGFSPHTSRLRTIPTATIKLLEDCGYDGKIIKLAVTRAYQIRHGAGPMVTESPEWLEKILPGSSKNENRWQGKVRIGPLDLVTLKYALDVCGGPEFFDGLALTWFDQVQAVGKWEMCLSYQEANNPEFFSNDGSRIKVSSLKKEEQLKRQARLTEKLFACRPNLISYDVKGKNQTELIKLSSEILQAELKLPLRLISFGPTEADKILC